jgi:hypothetical protein
MSWFGFGKQSTTWTENQRGEIERVDIVDGEVVDDINGNTSEWTRRAWEWFYSRNHNQTVGGSKWERRSKNTDDQYHDGKGHAYNFHSQEWTYEKGYDRPANWLPQTIIEGYGDDRATDSGL